MCEPVYSRRKQFLLEPKAEEDLQPGFLNNAHLRGGWVYLLKLHQVVTKHREPGRDNTCALRMFSGKLLLGSDMAQRHCLLLDCVSLHMSHCYAIALLHDVFAQWNLPFQKVAP